MGNLLDAWKKLLQPVGGWLEKFGSGLALSSYGELQAIGDVVDE
jgi:hypothetical protein